MPPERDMARLGRGASLPDALVAILGEDQHQWPPEACFLMAAYHGNICQMKRIAATGLDLEGMGVAAAIAKTKFMGMNALHAVSSANGMLPPFQYLVEEVKMEINDPDDMGRTPLEHAVIRGHLSAVRYLLDHGADLHHQCSSGNGETILHRAAENGRSEIAKYLISRGAQVNEEGDSGTALALAAGGGYTSTVKILLEHDADPNKAKKHAFLPLSLALNISSMACVKLLIQAGADVDGFGPCYNPLATSVEKGLTEAVRWLLEAGANPNVPDRFGRLPIELAVQYGCWEDVEILFNFTSPIPSLVNWSIDGIIRHVQLEIKQLQDDTFVERALSDLKRQGDEAFKQDYLNASVYYTQGDTLQRWRTEPSIMITGSGRWVPPALTSSRSPNHEKESTFAAGRSRHAEVERTLTDSQRDEFEDIL